VTIAITLAIDPSSVERGVTTATLAARLVNLGSALFSWTPELAGVPAKARFKFESEAARDRFALRALRIPGVSLVTTP
jgi:hypothetical protein